MGGTRRKESYRFKLADVLSSKNPIEEYCLKVGIGAFFESKLKTDLA